MIKSFTKFNGLSSLILIVLIGLNGCSKKGPDGVAPPNLYGIVSTFAGGEASRSNDGTGAAAGFFFPTGITIDVLGNLYVADSGNNMIRKITPAGVVTTVAGFLEGGTADGTGKAAGFHYPYNIAIDAAGNLYVTDQGNQKIRKITTTGVVTTLAGTGQTGSNNGAGNQATFYSPSGIVVDASGNVFVSEQGNNVIRKITPEGMVSTFAGSGNVGSADGTGTAASFYVPSGLAIDASNNIYVADAFNNKIRKISPAGVVTTFAGTGIPGDINASLSLATFSGPTGVAVGDKGVLYVTDKNNHLIRKLIP